MTAEAAQVTSSSDKAGLDRGDPRWLRARATAGPGYAGFVLPGLPEAAPFARSLVRRALGRDNALAEVVILCTSELVTNAISHTRSGLPGGMFAVTVRREPGGTVLVSVLDEGARTGPQPSGPAAFASPGEEHGRGLGIVRDLSEDWGTVRMFAGRLTWCRLGRGDGRRDALRDGGHDGARDAGHDGARDGSRAPGLDPVRARVHQRLHRGA